MDKITMRCFEFFNHVITRNDGQNGGRGGLLLGNGVFKNGWSVTVKCMEQ